MTPSNSFLTISKAFTCWNGCISGLEASQHNLILAEKGVEFCPLFSTLDLTLPNYVLTVLKVFSDRFACIAGLEISQHKVILILWRGSNQLLFFNPKIMTFSNYFLTALKSICLLIFMLLHVKVTNFNLSPLISGCHLLHFQTLLRESL